MAQQTETESIDERDLETLFLIFDTENSGFIKLTDLDTCFWIFNLNKDDFIGLVNSEEEEISQEDFLKLMKEAENSSYEADTVYSAFQHFDGTKDGVISEQHLQSILTDFGGHLKPDQASKLTKLVTDGKPTLNYAAFIKYMTDLDLLRKPKQIFDEQPIVPQKAKKTAKKKVSSKIKKTSKPSDSKKSKTQKKTVKNSDGKKNDNKIKKGKKKGP